jgi:hypothetical protein
MATNANETQSATNPLFTVTFDVKSSDNYGDFIAGLRQRLGNPRHFSHNRPVLPPVEAGPPRRWFHVVLRTQATRADNLYLEGATARGGSSPAASSRAPPTWASAAPTATCSATRIASPASPSARSR